MESLQKCGVLFGFRQAKAYKNGATIDCHTKRCKKLGSLER